MFRMNTRQLLLLLALMQSCWSLCFSMTPGLVFMDGETGVITPVRALYSQGGDENALIVMGGVCFFVLFLFNWLRIHKALTWLDIYFWVFCLLLQLLALCLIEVGSIGLTLSAKHGGVFWIWLLHYSLMWGVVFWFFGVRRLGSARPR